MESYCCKGPESILGFAGHLVPVTTAQPGCCCCRTNINLWVWLGSSTWRGARLGAGLSLPPAAALALRSRGGCGEGEWGEHKLLCMFQSFYGYWVEDGSEHVKCRKYIRLSSPKAQSGKCSKCLQLCGALRRCEELRMTPSFSTRATHSTGPFLREERLEEK